MTMGYSFEFICSRPTQAVPGVFRQRMQARTIDFPVAKTKLRSFEASTSVPTFPPPPPLLSPSQLSPLLNPNTMSLYRPAVQFFLPPPPLRYLPSPTSRAVPRTAIEIRTPAGRLMTADMLIAAKALPSSSNARHAKRVSKTGAPSFSTLKVLPLVPPAGLTSQAPAASTVKISPPPEVVMPFESEEPVAQTSISLNGKDEVFILGLGAQASTMSKISLSPPQGNVTAPTLQQGVATAGRVTATDLRTAALNVQAAAFIPRTMPTNLPPLSFAAGIGAFSSPANQIRSSSSAANADKMAEVTERLTRLNINGVKHVPFAQHVSTESTASRVMRRGGEKGQLF
jgi:hypothetical protein